MLLAWFLFQAITGIGSVLLLVVVSLFLAAGLNPSVVRLERAGLKRSYAVCVVTIGVLSALALFVVALVPVIADQISSITANAPDWLSQLQQNERVRSVDDEYQIIEKLQDYVVGGDFLSQLFGGVLGIGLAVLSALFNAFIVVVLTLYFLSSLEVTKHALHRLAPASRRERVTLLGDRIVSNIGGYVSGAFVVALCAGATSFVFLMIVGLGEYAVALPSWWPCLTSSR